MIVVNRLDGKQMVVNADHVVSIESTPDTLLHLTSGAKLLVRDTAAEVIALVIDYRRRIFTALPQLVTPVAHAQAEPASAAPHNVDKG